MISVSRFCIFFKEFQRCIKICKDCHVNKKAHSVFLVFEHDIYMFWLEFSLCVYCNSYKIVTCSICKRVLGDVHKNFLQFPSYKSYRFFSVDIGRLENFMSLITKSPLRPMNQKGTVGDLSKHSGVVSFRECFVEDLCSTNPNKIL